MPESSTSRPLALIILAAGKGTRMRSQLPKVLHPILGRSILDWVLAAAAPLAAQHTVVVVGHDADAVTATLPDGVATALQEEQRGSGDAVAAGMTALTDFDGDVLVINGDGALFTTATLTAVVAAHNGDDETLMIGDERAPRSHATALAIDSQTPLPYGRVIVTADGSIARIVEARDASADELSVTLLNAGVYCFDAQALRKALPMLHGNNDQGELYITDLPRYIAAAGGTTRAAIAGGEEELLGVNTRADLAIAEEILQRRILDAHMTSGVTVHAPHTTTIEPTVTLEADAVIEPGSVLRGSTHVEARAVIGPHSVLIDTRVDEGARVVQSHCVEAHVGPGASVGPFAYLRPEAALARDAKAGAFVEIKKSHIGARAKVPHLSYIGDADVGEDANIGAGTITANYRPELGSGKQRTVIGRGARTGSDNVFVAPVTIGDGAFTAAGSTIVEDVPADSLAIARARQVNLPDYGQRLRARADSAPAGDIR